MQTRCCRTSSFLRRTRNGNIFLFKYYFAPSLRSSSNSRASEGLSQAEVEAVGLGEARLGALSTGSLSGERASLRSLRTTQGLGRRGRKVYHITDRGRQEFMELLGDPATLDDSKNFWLRMALGKFLSTDLRVGLLERRRADLVARLAEVRAGAQNEQLDGFARSVMEHAAQGVELDLAWIDDWLSTERSSEQSFAQETK